MKTFVDSTRITKVNQDQSKDVDDILVIEEPMEIRLKFFNGIDFQEQRLSVTMRTPGNDFELAIGFLFTEGIIKDANEVEKIFHCQEIKAPEEEGNVVIVVLKENVALDKKTFDRNFYVNSSCGVCGKSSIESIDTICEDHSLPENFTISSDILVEFPEKARENQTVFEHTGGIHAAALFNQSGKLLVIREDVGRHNAVDKVVGARLYNGLSNDNTILFVSGRAGFELVQKAIVAGVPIMQAVGAPSSLAVNTAKKYNLTLVGFSRGEKFNIYSGQSRIDY